MTAPEQVASTAQEQAGAVAGTAKDQAVSVANTATVAAGEVTGSAKEQVGNVVGETVAQAKDLTGQVRQQATQQVAGQTQKATSALRDLSRQLNEGDTSGYVGTVLTEVGQRVQAFADTLEQKGPQGLIDDARRYARRSPGTFVLGAALAGLVAGRIGKGISASSGSSTASGSSARTASGQPLAGRTVPSTGGTYTGTAAHPAASAPGNDPFGGDTYGGTTPASGTSTKTYGSLAEDDLAGDLADEPLYPAAGSGDPYSAGYGQSEAYGSRGTL